MRAGFLGTALALALGMSLAGPAKADEIQIAEIRSVWDACGKVMADKQVYVAEMSDIEGQRPEFKPKKIDRCAQAKLP